MGLLSRISLIFKAKANKVLDKAENPNETLDYSYERQLEQLQNFKRAIVDITTSKKRLELQSAQLKADIERMDTQARQALAAGREDLARAVLLRKTTAQQQLDDLNAQINTLNEQQQKLADAEARLSAKIEAFRTQKEVIKAQYSAAQAQVRISEAVTGISEEMTDIGTAIERARNKTATMQARAGAIDELVNSGVLADVTQVGGGSDVDRELAHLSASASVDEELARMKAELGAPQQQQTLPPPGPSSSQH
jgi:phage shock protein A